jgi:hypothetical protein
MGFFLIITDRVASVMALRRNKQHGYMLDTYDGCGMSSRYPCEPCAAKSGRRERGVGWGGFED